MQNVKLGRYKIAFWQPSDAIIIYSKMFDDLNAAKLEADALHKAGYLYTIMEIRVISDGAYTWEVLEEGVGKHLPLLSKVWANKIPISACVGLLLLGQAMPK
jgi:hypothetical protein